MSAEFLIIGLATDGPSNVAHQPKDLKELNSLFGANLRERFIVSASATALTTTFVPVSLPTNEVDSRKQYLFSPYLDFTNKQNLYFGMIGGTGIHTVDLLYTPYLDTGDLVVAATRYYNATSTMPYVVRLGGNTATCSVSGWTFEAKYAGQKYNSLKIIVSGSTLTVSGMEPNYMAKTYSMTNRDSLVRTIEMDFDLGTSPIVCTASVSAMVPSGTFSFSGGTDGSFTDSDFDYFLSNMTIPISSNHVLVLQEITSGMVTSITNALLDTTAQPRMFFIPAITYTSTGAADWITTVNQQLPYRNNMISAFIGNISIPYANGVIDRFAAEGAAIAYAKSSGYNLTNLPMEAETFYPVLSEADLDLVKINGFVPIMRYIDNDISVYEGTTTARENTFLFSSKIAEISSVAYNYCFQYYGTVLPDGDKPEIASELASRISLIEFIQLQRVSVTKAGENMYVSIDAFLPDEILNISFCIQNSG